ncbi:hypothetical protein SOP89_13580 [Pseudomonas siliginis]|uniref:hypothetical protein n=1 Tax=Pseudomonas siliginis TaxID=2842346 RepID=UPI002B248CD5|nr:hypothetical protein [Pseudomonas siliginis]MEB2652403.1 hypothetical protein [Pseudomonas siliginis]
MNKKIFAMSFFSLCLIGPLYAWAAETTAGAATPATALPGVNHAQSSSDHDEKANKKGEESSGANAGSEPHETEKDAATSSDSEDLEKKTAQ